MPETGTLLKDYALPIISIFELILSMIGGVFVVASVIACVKSANSRKSRVEQLEWRLKSVRYMKIWILIFAVTSIFGIAIYLIIGQKILIFVNLFLVILFLISFAVIRQTYSIALKEFNFAKAVYR